MSLVNEPFYGGPFDLMSTVVISRAASPTLTFEELFRILGEEWERLPEEEKTPYRDRANERRLQHETMGAAIALTQVETTFCFSPMLDTPFVAHPSIGSCLKMPCRGLHCLDELHPPRDHSTADAARVIWLRHINP